MATYRVTSPEGTSFDVEGDSPPNEQELEEIFSSLPKQNVPRGTIPALTEEEQFGQQFTAQAQRSPFQRATDIAKIGPNLLGSLVETLTKGAQGAYQMGEGSVQTAIQNAVLNQLTGGDRTTSIPRIAAGNIAQTGLEAGGRVGFDILNAPRQLGQVAPDLTANILSAIANNPGAVSGGLPLLSTLGIQALTPRTPSQAEISEAFEQQLANQPFEDVREQPIAAEIFGTANIPAAEAIPIAAGLAEAAPGLVRMLPGFAKETARTAATILTSPFSGYRAASKAGPALSGAAEAEAAAGLESALQRQATLNRSIQEAIQKEALGGESPSTSKEVPSGDVTL